MAKQYWLGEFFVDLSRNQISQQTQTQTLPPKALLVLTHLAENQGKVVTYDELLDKVWPNAVVTPNTLQRSIAQLRKALGENSKAQEVIKTHAKQGYSLECDVTWFEESKPPQKSELEPEPANEQTAHLTSMPDSMPLQHNNQHVNATAASTPQTRNRLYWLTGAVTLLFIVIFFARVQNTPETLQFDQMHYLTATDDKEFGASYSPDGNHIVFHRYFEHLCINHLWAKNASTLQEFQLTAQRGTYNSHSMSPDGQTLAFIQQEDCTKPVSQNTCYRLMSMDFAAALAAPQLPNELLRCENSAIRDPVWIDNQHIVLMQRNGERWRLIRFAVADGSSGVFYDAHDGNILNFDYSPSSQQFAVATMKSDGIQYIEMLGLEGNVLSSQPIQVPADAPRLLIAAPKFIPGSNKLIFGFNGLLYTLDATGLVSQVDFPFDEKVGAPRFHPHGNKLLLIKGVYDADVASLSLDNTGDVLKPVVFERSTQEEGVARFQPHSDNIAFFSGRTGEQQVWLKSTEGTHAVSALPKGTVIDDLHWDSEGKQLLLLTDHELQILSLDKQATKIALDFPVLFLFHWDSINQQAIASALVNGLFQFVEIDLNTLTYRIINDHKTKHAAKSAEGSLIYVDAMGRFWQQGPVEGQVIEALKGQSSGTGFVVRENRIYGVNRDNRLWHYNLQTKVFEWVGQLPETIDKLYDVKDNRILMSIVVSAKKEVVELSLVQQ